MSKRSHQESLLPASPDSAEYEADQAAQPSLASEPKKAKVISSSLENMDLSPESSKEEKKEKKVKKEKKEKIEPKEFSIPPALKAFTCTNIRAMSSTAVSKAISEEQKQNYIYT